MHLFASPDCNRMSTNRTAVRSSHVRSRTLLLLFNTTLRTLRARFARAHYRYRYSSELVWVPDDGWGGIIRLSV